MSFMWGRSPEEVDQAIQDYEKQSAVPELWRLGTNGYKAAMQAGHIPAQRQQPAMPEVTILPSNDHVPNVGAIGDSIQL